MTYIKFINKLWIVISCMFLHMFAVGANAQLSVGATAPMFTTSAALAGQTFKFSLSEALVKGPAVVYFYPKAFTTGCTIEANLFAEASDKFARLHTTVVGVSADDIDTLLKFSTGPCGGKFAVASDQDLKIIQAYRAALKVRPDMADRISYVITPDRKILSVISSANPDQHVNQSLQAIKAWGDRSIKN
ncbi:peroxiredoxin [Sheuella amnicola]|nr:peroxiredoxin [Sheuella amnicola]